MTQASAQLTTFAVNFVGHPFNQSVFENKGMATCLTGMTGFLALLALDPSQTLNRGFGLVPIPDAMRWQLLGSCLGAAAVCFVWEQALRRAFPAAQPPRKGYLAHGVRLRRLGAGAGASNSAVVTGGKAKAE